MRNRDGERRQKYLHKHKNGETDDKLAIVAILRETSPIFDSICQVRISE
ncbi:MAG: hypothetical protein AB8U25_00490 [Rickettsiales endosymbiont of Dermacentor nuttalli]